MRQWIVLENRTEALDLSRDIIRKGLVHLPRQTPIVEEFAKHMASNAKRLEEDEETGEARYKYIKAGAGHFSLALTYNCIAALRDATRGEPCVLWAPLDPDNIWSYLDPSRTNVRVERVRV